MSKFEEIETRLAMLRKLAASRSDTLIEETEKFIRDNREFARTDSDTLMTEAVRRFNEGELYAAEQIGRLIIQSVGKEIRSLHLLATIATRLGNHEDSVDLLLDCLDINPDLAFIRYELANAFFKSGRFDLALSQSAELLAREPNNIDCLVLKAASLVKLGQYEPALLAYESGLESRPDDAAILLRYGLALRIVGRAPEAIEAFRKVLAFDTQCGEAYWNLANLKTFAFEVADVEQMQAALQSDQLNGMNRIYFLFSLGKAMNDSGDFKKAFQYYSEGNEMAKELGKYDPADTSELVNRSKRTFTREYFDAHQGGCNSDEPIFIVGLPRSGSTLLEQILSSHSAVDATMELSEIAAMARSLNNPQRTGLGAQYPEMMLELQPGGLERLGQEYLKRTKGFRGKKRLFIDKAPHNFLHIGLIATILPNARIIDARRDPLACGFSIYTQFFARGTAYAYDLQHIASYYTDYLRLMDHWHEVLPGKVLTVRYEDVIADMEQQLRRILGYCGLEFEPGCLEFYNSKRAVATVSSEQVRQPVYNSAVEHWKNYASHLEPLKQTLQRYSN